MWLFRFDVDSEVKKVDEVEAAPSAAVQQKKSSKSTVSDQVETAGMLFTFMQLTFFHDICCEQAILNWSDKIASH